MEAQEKEKEKEVRFLVLTSSTKMKLGRFTS